MDTRRYKVKTHWFQRWQVAPSLGLWYQSFLTKLTDPRIQGKFENLFLLPQQFCIHLVWFCSCSFNFQPQNSLVIRQKSESQNGGNMKAKHAKFSEKQTCTCAYQGLRNIRFSENLVCFAFLLPVLRFAILLYYQRTILYQTVKLNNVT